MATPTAPIPSALPSALANLDLIEKEQLVSGAAARGKHLHARLQAAFGDHPLVGDIRGLGLIGAVEFVARKDPATAFDPKLTVAARIVKAALARGVISRALPNADTIAFSPPLIITESEIDTLVTGMRDAADIVMAELIKEGSWRS